MHNTYATNIWSKGESSDLAHRDAPKRRRLGYRMAEHWEFLSAFLRQPAVVGAIAPSSSALANALLNHCDLRNGVTIVELGSGTGAVTRQILDRIGRKTTFLALELDTAQTKRLKHHYPRLAIYNDSAEHIQKYLNRHGREKADYIISSLPWGMMDQEMQDRILDAVLASLKPGGLFTTYAYLHSRWLPSGRYLLRRLKNHFTHVQTSRIVWYNLPPAFVYRCR